MKTKRSLSVLPAIVLTAALAVTAFGQDTKPSPAAPLSAERTVLVTVTASVEAIAQAKREVTLLAAFMGLVIFMILALDQPFRGGLGLGAEPYQLIYDQLMKSSP